MGYTAVQIAATEGHAEVVRFLIKQGADINVQDKVHGNTALHEACWRGYSRTVTIIAKSKSNLHILNNGGFAALHLCCQNGHNQSCRELLLAGCSPDIKNNVSILIIYFTEINMIYLYLLQATGNSRKMKYLGTYEHRKLVHS